MKSRPEKYINEHGVECYRNVHPETLFKDLEFLEVPENLDGNTQFALHTNLGSLTVLDRLTGFSGGVRDTETGYRDSEKRFWLAEGMSDVRRSGAVTIQDAIDWVKANATWQDVPR